MSNLEDRFFGWNTNTDWTKCKSKDCIETIGVFTIDSQAGVTHFENICNLSNMIESDKSSYDNGDISYGTTLSFFNQIINLELQREDGFYALNNDFTNVLLQEKNETINSIDISYGKDYFSKEFSGYLYTGMNFELVSSSQGVEPCTLFFGSDENFYLENISTDDGQEITTEDGKNLAIRKPYGAQSIFLSKTGPLDYKPFCDQSMEFGSP